MDSDSCGVNSAILQYLECILELYLHCFHYSYHPLCERALKKLLSRFYIIFYFALTNKITPLILELFQN